jgi:lysophospholipase L1-like esterase
MLTRFFGDRIAVANHAESGESLRSSAWSKRLDKVLSLMKPGDHLLIQYGHNDEKEKGEGVERLPICSKPEYLLRKYARKAESLF